MNVLRRHRGFTLVEIMIVVAIIVLLAAIAIPNLLRSRLNANEASAIASMRVIATAAVTYRANNPTFPADLGMLANATPAYIDTFLGTGLKQGYNFTVTGGWNTFNATGVPVQPNVTGVRCFFVDESCIVRASSNGSPADASSPTLE